MAQRDHGDDQRNHAKRRDGEEDAAPTGQVCNDAGERRPKKISRDDGREPAADCNLPLRHRNEIADHCHADRENSAGCGARNDARNKDRREVGREAAHQHRCHCHREAGDHDTHLADHVAHRPEHRLHQRERQRKSGRQQRDRVGST